MGAKDMDSHIDQMIQERIQQKYNNQNNMHIKKITRYVGNAKRMHDRGSAGVGGGILGTSTF